MPAVRSKAGQKQVYLAAGIATARQSVVTSLHAAREFVASVGYPAFLKPEYGVGAVSTRRIDSDADLVDAVESLPAISYVLEEYVTGDIWTYDAILDATGNPRFETSTRCPPSLAEIVETGGDVWYRVEKEMPPALRQLGRRTVAAFGMRNRFVHLEFFCLTLARPGLGDVGEFVALEANMRPAGGYSVDMYNYAAACDVYQIYADVVTRHDTGAAAQATRHREYCVYGARRDVVSYVMARDQLLARYAGEIVRVGRNPDLFRASMADEFVMIRTASNERAHQFVADVTTRA